jgi:hypothetical protein
MNWKTGLGMLALAAALAFPATAQAARHHCKFHHHHRCYEHHAHGRYW